MTSSYNVELEALCNALEENASTTGERPSSYPRPTGEHTIAPQTGVGIAAVESETSPAVRSKRGWTGARYQRPFDTQESVSAKFAYQRRPGSDTEETAEVSEGTSLAPKQQLSDVPSRRGPEDKGPMQRSVVVVGANRNLSEHISSLVSRDGGFCVETADTNTIWSRLAVRRGEVLLVPWGRHNARFVEQLVKLRVERPPIVVLGQPPEKPSWWRSLGVEAWVPMQEADATLVETLSLVLDLDEDDRAHKVTEAGEISAEDDASTAAQFADIAQQMERLASDITQMGELATRIGRGAQAIAAAIHTLSSAVQPE